jgi:hypothetical protein
VTCGLNELPCPGVIGLTAFSVGEGAADELGATLDCPVVFSGSVFVAVLHAARIPPATARPPSNATPRLKLFDDMRFPFREQVRSSF